MVARDRGSSRGGGGLWDRWLVGMGSLLVGGENVLNSAGVVVAQLCEYTENH